MRTTDADMPDGVADGDTVANAIMTDYHRARAIRNWVAGHAARETTTRDTERLPLASPEGQRRAALFERARQGDQDARQGLWERYKLKLTLGG